MALCYKDLCNGQLEAGEAFRTASKLNRHIRAETARLCFYLPERFWRKSSNDKKIRQQPVLAGRKHRAYKELHASLDADRHMCAVSARGVPIV